RHARRDGDSRGSGGARDARRPRRGTRASRADARPAPRRGGDRAVTAPRFQLADELLRRLAASLRSMQLYSKGHPIISRNLEQFSAAVQRMHSLAPTTVVGFVGDEIIVDDMPIAKAETLGPIVGRLQKAGIDRINFDRGVTSEELATFIEAVS